MTQKNLSATDAGPTRMGAGSHRSLLFENSWFPTMDRRVLVALLTIDLILIALHIAAGAVFDEIPLLLNIAFDNSLGEIVGYAKWTAIIVILWLVSRRDGSPALLACAALFAMMLADDSLQIHERLGQVAANAERISATSWATGQTLGEIAVWIALALLLLPVILFGFAKSTRAQWRPALRFLGLVALFAVFGGLVDALHQPVSNLPFGPQLADLVEDGGEMVVASMIVAHAVALWNAPSFG